MQFCHLERGDNIIPFLGLLRGVTRNNACQVSLVLNAWQEVSAHLEMSGIILPFQGSVSLQCVILLRVCLVVVSRDHAGAPMCHPTECESGGGVLRSRRGSYSS